MNLILIYSEIGAICCDVDSRKINVRSTPAMSLDVETATSGEVIS